MSARSSTELSGCEREKDKPKDTSRSPSQRKHKKSKHSKKKSKKKSSKRKKHRNRSRSRSKERREENGTQSNSLEGKSHELSNQEAATNLLTSRKIDNHAATNQSGKSANQEEGSTTFTNQDKCLSNKLAVHEYNGNSPSFIESLQNDLSANQDTASRLEATQDVVAGTVATLNVEPGIVVANKAVNEKCDVIESRLTLNEDFKDTDDSSSQIYDPGLYIAKVQDKNESQNKDAKKSFKSGSILGKLSGPVKESMSGEKSLDLLNSQKKMSSSEERKSRSRSNERSRSLKDKGSRSKGGRSRSKDRRSRASRQNKSRSRSGSQGSRSKGKRSRSKDEKPRSRGQISRSKGRSRSASKPRSRSKDQSPGRSPARSPANKSRKRSRDKSRNRSSPLKKSNSRERFRGNSEETAEKRSQSRKTLKRSRTRDRSKDRRSQEKSHSRQEHRLKSREHRRSKSRERKRSRSRERPRSRSYERNRYNSGYQNYSRYRRSRSNDRQYGSRSVGHRWRSRSHERRRRSRSKSRNRQSQSKDFHRSRSRTPRKSDRSDDRKKRSESGDHVAASVPVNLTIAFGVPTTSVTTSTADTVKSSKSIADFTALCKKLTESKEDENGVSENAIADDVTSQVYHPFSVKPAKDIVIPPVILPVSKPVEPVRPLEQAFPVSSGNQHKTKENTNEATVEGIDGSVAAAEQVFQAAIQTEKLDVSGLIAKRMEAQNRLQSNPHDLEARLVLEEVQMKIQNWASINLKPGQFTGESLVSPFAPKENINSGYQAWARKDMFHNLAPIRGGVGMRLLQKMGWKPGQIIGKRGEGGYEPIALTVKTDRKGLVSFGEPGGGKGKGGGKGGGKNILAAQAVQGISAMHSFLHWINNICVMEPAFEHVIL